MTTIKTSNERILKEDLVKDIYFEEGKPIKVYNKIAQLNNLGRTYFVHTKELMEKKNQADTNMLQKYGTETWGDLIKCDISELMDLSKLTESVIKEGKGTFNDFKTARDELIKYASKADDNWKKNVNWDEVKKNLDSVKEQQGASGKENAAAWTALQKIFKKQSSVWNSDSKLKKFVGNLEKGWQNFGGKVDAQQNQTAGGSTKSGSTLNSEDTTPRPELAIRITIETKFNEDWYKHKFKSGLLNKMIFAIKTDAMSRTSPTVKANDTNRVGHKYTADEMLPEEKRKLDSIKWKMTNKVAKDYITQLLGWSRKKEKKMNEDGTGEIPVQQQLSQDKSFGKKLADKALGNRGILGRLRQQVFAGGQKSETISVAFQMADMNDGWKLIKEDDKGNPEGAGGGESNGTGEADKGGGAGKGGSAGGSGGGASSNGGNGSGSGNGGKANGAAANLDDKQLQSLLTLLQRVERIEDEVGVGPGSKSSKDASKENPKPEQNGNNQQGKQQGQGDNKKEQANESSDPFYDVFVDDCISDKRRGLVKGVCEDGSFLDNLVDDCIFGDIV